MDRAVLGEREHPPARAREVQPPLAVRHVHAVNAEQTQTDEDAVRAAIGSDSADPHSSGLGMFTVDLHVAHQPDRCI